jgi:hypothetical protein
MRALIACVQLLRPTRAFTRRNHALIRRGQRAVLRELLGTPLARWRPRRAS